MYVMALAQQESIIFERQERAKYTKLALGRQLLAEQTTYILLVWGKKVFKSVSKLIVGVIIDTNDEQLHRTHIIFVVRIPSEKKGRKVTLLVGR